MSNNICTVWELLKYQDNTPREGSIGYATITELPYDYVDKLFTNYSDDGVSAISNESGLISWSLIWGVTILFEIEDVGLGKTVIIPEVDSVRLSDL